MFIVIFPFFSPFLNIFIFCLCVFLIVFRVTSVAQDFFFFGLNSKSWLPISGFPPIYAHFVNVSFCRFKDRKEQKRWGWGQVEVGVGGPGRATSCRVATPRKHDTSRPHGNPSPSQPIPLHVCLSRVFPSLFPRFFLAFPGMRMTA